MRVKSLACEMNVNRGEVWWHQFRAPVGTRPCIVLSDLPADTAANRLFSRLLVVPTTTRVDKWVPREALIRGGLSRTKVGSMQMVSRKKLLGFEARLDASDMEMVDEAAFSALSLLGRDCQVKGHPGLGAIITIVDPGVWPDHSRHETPLRALVLSKPSMARLGSILAAPIRPRSEPHQLMVPIGPNDNVVLSKLRNVSVESLGKQEDPLTNQQLEPVTDMLKQIMGYYHPGLTRSPRHS